jgi:NAD(P)-dependent dehydrogenase (short-subunit alcohol dehydrogenase family)
MNKRKTIIITGGSQGIGAAAVSEFLKRDYNVTATSRDISKSRELHESDRLLKIDGNIGDPAVATRIARATVERFGAIDALVNNAGIFFTKPFVDYSVEDFMALSETNLGGFIYITQEVVRQILSQNSSGSIVSITTALVQSPIAGVNVVLPMITKGGIDAATRSLAMEYAKAGIRFNAVAPGIVDTPLHKDDPKEFLKTLSPMEGISTAQEIVDAIVYLTEAPRVTGEVLHVDGGSHVGRW